MIFKRNHDIEPELVTDASPYPMPPKRPRGWRSFSTKKKRWSVVIVILLLLVGTGSYFFLAAGHGKFSLKSLAASAIKSELGKSTPIKGQSSGRTTFLVYGMTQDGLRTDSIMLVSYYWQQKKLVTVNIPRDLYVYDGYENAKMGEVYAYAVERQPKDSTYPDSYVASIISKEYNTPVDYWVQFNMQGEVDLVNAIGGVTINVPDAFTDYQYPTANYSGYVRPAPSFKAGQQHMDGATALIYSRSRHSLDNNEGTDFARSNRQAQVLQAIGTTIKSQGIVGNLTQISHYLNILGDNLTTSMSTDEMVSFAKTLTSINPATDYIHGNWATGNGFLCDSSTTSGAYVTLYGTSDSCTISVDGIGAGGFKDSHARELAIYYVQHLLTSAPMTPSDFVTSATQALWPTPTPAATLNSSAH